MARSVEGVETKDLKSLADDGKKQIGSGVVAIVGVTETARPAWWSA
jgi:alanyl-tRNA synthetase